MADKLRTGTPADIVILTAAIVAKLAEEKLVVATSIADVGLVETALAVRTGDPQGHGQGCGSAARRACWRRTRSSCRTPKPRRPESTSQRSCSNSASPTRLRRASGFFRTARPRCANWRHPTRQRRSAARSRPRSSAPRASCCPVRCRRAANSRPCTRPASPQRPPARPRRRELIALLIGAGQREQRERAGFISGRK